MDQRRWTAALWRERVAAQRASAVSIRAWRRHNGVPKHGFYGCRPRRGLSPAGAVRRRAALGEDPLSGQLFVFRSRSGEAKVLQGDFARKGQGEPCRRGCAEGPWSAGAGCPFRGGASAVCGSGRYTSGMVKGRLWCAEMSDPMGIRQRGSRVRVSAGNPCHATSGEPMQGTERPTAFPPAAKGRENVNMRPVPIYSSGFHRTGEGTSRSPRTPRGKRRPKPPSRPRGRWATMTGSSRPPPASDSATRFARTADPGRRGRYHQRVDAATENELPTLSHPRQLFVSSRGVMRSTVTNTPGDR
jgi:hypothetical protein